METLYDVPKDKPIAKPIHQSLKGKVVLVTGSSSGIGAATGIAFARNGCKVAFHGRNTERLKLVEDICLKEGADKKDIYAVTGDITKTEDTERLVKETVEKFGKLDILVNNAGAGNAGTFENTSLDQLDLMYQTNVRSVFHITQVALPYLKESKGNIVVVSSIGGVCPFPQYFAYNAAKAMVSMFTKTLALDLAREGVRVNSINPAAIRTRFFRGTNTGARDDKSQDAAIAKAYESADKGHPIGRSGWAEEVAEGIVFLASDTAGFITGLELVIDGGLSLSALYSFKDL